MKTKNRKIFIKHFILAVVLIAIACEGISLTPIGKIINNPREYDGKKVTIQGKVTDVFSFFFIKYFKVKDKTGEIFVVTKRTLPKKGEKVKIKGVVKTAFALGEKQLTVILEGK